MTDIVCPHCGHSTKTSIVYAYIRYKCPKCSRDFVVDIDGDDVRTRPQAEVKGWEMNNGETV